MGRPAKFPELPEINHPFRTDSGRLASDIQFNQGYSGTATVNMFIRDTLYGSG
jgi:hypothetical protein